MSRARKRHLPVLRLLGLLAAGGVWALACGGPQPLGAGGSVCFRADDCQAGLACVPQTPGAAKHVCSADLSGIVSMVDGAVPEAGDMQDAGGGLGAPQAGSPAAAGAPSGAGAGGKAEAGGAPGIGGASATAGAPTSAGASAAGGASAGAAAGGSASAGTAQGGASAGGGG